MNRWPSERVRDKLVRGGREGESAHVNSLLKQCSPVLRAHPTDSGDQVNRAQQRGGAVNDDWLSQ